MALRQSFSGSSHLALSAGSSYGFLGSAWNRGRSARPSARERILPTAVAAAVGSPAWSWPSKKGAWQRSAELSWTIRGLYVLVYNCIMIPNDASTMHPLSSTYATCHIWQKRIPHNQKRSGTVRPDIRQISGPSLQLGIRCLANLEHGEPLVLTADLASYCHHPGGDREICRDFLPFIFPHFLTSPTCEVLGVNDRLQVWQGAMTQGLHSGRRMWW